MFENIEDEISICPHCGKGIKPSIYYDIKYKDFEYGCIKLAILGCPVCKETFFADYTLCPNPLTSKNFITNCNLYPNIIDTYQEFDKRIKDISPDFCKIYNQSLAAESNSLTEIVGLGYRKSFEVLVKDYAISLNANINSEEILKLSLKQTIDKYFKNSDFEPIFRKISWLGNDHSHTFNKHENYDINDLKRFIKACVSKIISQLDLDELNSIEPHK